MNVMNVEMSCHGELQIYTHFFAIIPTDLRLKNLIFKYAYNFIEMDWKWDPQQNRNVRVVGKVWGGRLEDNSQFRYPISLLSDFYSFLDREGYSQGYLKITTAAIYEAAVATFKLRDIFIPYDYQEEGITFTFEQKSVGIKSVLLMMPTGTGKTVTLLAFASRLGLRMGMVIAPAHMDKWVADGLV